MKALLLSITAGEGHNRVTRTVKEELEERGIECESLDTLKFINEPVGEAVDKGYLLTTRYTTGAYRAFYSGAYGKRKNRGRMSAGNIVSRALASGRLYGFIDAYKPDVIICPHVFTCQLVNSLKMEGKFLDIPLVGILTDYTIHPFWSDIQNIDYIVTPNELIEAEAVRKGIEREKLLPFGVPIPSRFAETGSKDGARRELGIDEDIQTVLLMSGSMGFGNLEENVRKLDEIPFDLQVLAVCGNNKKAKDRLDKMTFQKNVKVYGFVDNIDVMMDASDIMISKPGGVSTSEALAKRLPVIMINPIPGHEDRNAEFFQSLGAFVLATERTPVFDHLYRLSMCPERIELMRKGIDLIRKPDSTATLCDFVSGMGELE